LVGDASLTVRRARTSNLVNALTNDRLAHNQGGLAVVRGLSVSVRLGDRLHVVTIDSEHFPALRLEAHSHVLRLRVLGHLIKRHAVRVVHDNEVVKLLVARESGRLVGDALLQAAIAAQHDHVVVDDRMLSGVERRTSQLGSSRHANTVANTLAERARRRLDTWGPAKLRVARRLRVLSTEVLDFGHAQVEASHVQP